MFARLTLKACGLAEDSADGGRILILAALGHAGDVDVRAGGKQRELLEKFANLDMTVIAYSRAKQSSDGELKKQSREPLLRDFHMVGSGFDDQNPWEKLLIPLPAACSTLFKCHQGSII